jgi:acetoin utilization deacetylase AcuC-like enzyme
LPSTVLLVSHDRCLEHLTGGGHPERPARLHAVVEGIRAAGLAEAVVAVDARRATSEELAVVHAPDHVAAIEAFCAAGGGRVDPDTSASVGSWDAARLAAGAGLEAVARLDAGEAVAAFCAVRPPGHHATATRSMGFCLFNNVAVTAATLAARGERVLVVDYDAHHGNGTQAVFWDDPRVAYVSLHQWPLYPGTGALDEVGGPAALGLTANLPMPAGSTGDAYLAAVEEVVEPLAASFGPTWLLLSAGFDAHRADPLTGLGLSAGDYAELTRRLVALVPEGRRIAFLEGGYDLDALAASAAACVAALAGERLEPERPTSGGPGHEVVTAARLLRDRVGNVG